MPNNAVTLDELKIQLASECSFWGKREWDAFLTADPLAQQNLATAMRLSSASPGIDGWSIALTILKDAAPALGLIPTAGPFIEAAIEAITEIVGAI